MCLGDVKKLIARSHSEYNELESLVVRTRNLYFSIPQANLFMLQFENFCMVKVYTRLIRKKLKIAIRLN